jgi:Leucine-rich repeat (LRR) protein
MHALIGILLNWLVFIMRAFNAQLCIYQSCDCSDLKYTNDKHMIDTVFCKTDVKYASVLPKRLQLTGDRSYSIQSLYMANYNSTAFESKYFHNLNITLAVITDNKLTTLKTDAFDSILGISELDLCRNHLKSLDADSFAPLANSLVSLDLSLNQLTQIEPLAVLNKLVKLSLNNNQLQSISSLLSLEKLSSLELAGNDLLSIEAHTFPKSLVTLDLSRNKLRYVDDLVFRNLPFLNSLSIRANSISTIEADAFADLASLLSLNLGENLLENVDVKVFWPLSLQLRNLNFDRNRLNKWPTRLLIDLWDVLSNLVELSMTRNQFDSIPDLSRLGQLAKLNLANNFIETLRSVPKHLPSSLNELNLASNYILAIQSELFVNLKNLHTLNLEANKISFLASKAFESLDMLKVLILRGNSLKRVPSEQLFNLIGLESLDLSYQSRTTSGRLSVVDNYAFDRNSSTGRPLARFKMIDLRGNPIGRFGKKAFCSQSSSSNINIHNLHLEESRVYYLNPCLLKQINSGNGFPESSNIPLSASLNWSTVYFDRIHTSHNFKVPINLECDCERIKYLSSNNIELKGKVRVTNSQWFFTCWCY